MVLNDMGMKFFFETYGCQMNLAESAALKLAARERNWEEAPSPEEADLVLLNTCSVRQTAEQRVYGRLAFYGARKRKSSPERPFTLVVAGCMAERRGETLKEDFPGLDYVMGTYARSLFPLILEAVEKYGPGKQAPPALEELSGEEKPVFSFSPLHLEGVPLRSFIPIMHGCNNYCSYCIVPYVRGREVSRHPAAILEEIRLVGERGVREITLLGQNVNSYYWEGGGIDFPKLLELIALRLEKIGGPIRWVRFLSSHPKDLSDQAIRVMADHPIFCRHLHLCVQHGSNPILMAMNRRYTREAYLDLTVRLRRAMPELSLSTDLLIGFPGETEKDLEATLSLMGEVKFLYAYMYHYNPREGTAAFALPGRISEELKRERLSRVIELQKKHTGELLKSRLGARTRVLIEGISRKNADELISRTERDEMVVVKGPPALIGAFGELTLARLRGNTFRSKEFRLWGD
jgi:tRNA-2-methylthio-N6-dimethylallyladenosine synthase